MIAFNIILTFIPYYFHTVWFESGMINKHTAWEVQLYISSETLLTFKVQYTMNTDHAGFTFEIGLFGVVFTFSRYDTRHWNGEEKKFYEYS